MLQINEFKNKEVFISDILPIISDTISNNKVYIGLSGGSTPKPVYDALAKSALNLSKVSFYIVDERYISLDSSYSNYKMIFDTLIEPRIENIGGFSFFDTNLSIEACLSNYDVKLKEIPKQEFDLLILGIGPDGHIASLFPRVTALNEKNKFTAHTETDIFDVKNRLTLTPKIILKAKKILVLLRGEEKKATLKELISGKKEAIDFPAKILKQHKNVVINYLLN